MMKQNKDHGSLWDYSLLNHHTVYECFAYICACAPCACLTPMEARRGRHRLELELQPVANCHMGAGYFESGLLDVRVTTALIINHGHLKEPHGCLSQLSGLQCQRAQCELVRERTAEKQQGLLDGGFCNSFLASREAFTVLSFK